MIFTILVVLFLVWYIPHLLIKHEKLRWFINNDLRELYDLLDEIEWEASEYRAFPRNQSKGYYGKLSFWIGGGSFFCDLEGDMKGTLGLIDRHIFYARIMNRVRLGKAYKAKTQLEEMIAITKKAQDEATRTEKDN